MFNSNSGYSLSDLAAATGANNNDLFGGGNAWWVILFFLIILGGYGNGFGTNNATSSGITDGYILTSDFASLERQIDSVQDNLRQQGVQLGNGISSLGYDQLNQMNNINTNINNATNTVTAGITALGSQMASSCCDLRYENATNFAALNNALLTQENATRQAINDSTNAIIGYLTQDKISTLESENQALRLAASQQAQNNYLVNAINPQAVPAYIVANPNTGTYTTTCGCSAY